MTAFALFVLAVSPGQVPSVEFNRDVRPILSDNCFACHGPDKNKRKAKLRLDDRDAAIEKGAIVPGKPNESELIARIILPETDEHAMPPKESHKKLSAKQIETLKTWVAQGAKYQPHWAYIAPTRPSVPAGANAIDHFIAAELAKVKATMSPEADRRTLIRRLSLDLTGLPPRPEDVDAFVKDTSPNAYEKLVDRLIASPQYGERMATPWLDLVRFADTVGYHGDQNQRIFPYRDYVIKAFNENKPFDQFTKEQIAGDLFEKPTKEQLVATGFNRLNMMTREGGAQPKEYLAKYQADRVRTVSMAWMGSTLGCAECHDHKFDPFTARDFYSMSAFFADIRQWGVYSDYNYTPNPDLKGWNNDFPFPPEVEVESEYLQIEINAIRRQLMAEALRKADELTRIGTAKETRSRWADFFRAYQSIHPTGWETPKPTLPSETIALDDGSIRLTGPVSKKPDAIKFIVEPTAGWLNSLKLELLPDDKSNGRIVRDLANTSTVNVTVLLRRKGQKDKPLKFFYGSADRQEFNRYVSTQPVLGLLNGWKTSSRDVTKPHTAIWLFDAPMKIENGDQIVVSVQADNLSRIRISTSPVSWDRLNGCDLQKIEHFSPRHREGAIGEVWDGQLVDPWSQIEFLSTEIVPSYREFARPLLKQLFDLNDGKAWTQVTVSQKPITTRILPRGNWMDETGPVVTPATPNFLPGYPMKPNQPMDRRHLAEWLVMKDNPLTARVFVNRLWKQFFGNGLSANLEDVGAQGEPPSHPELLDWLAVEFASDWNIKRAVKALVMSKAYRQASKAKLELREVDPSNRLLAYQNPRRLEAEFVRDNVLAISGLLETSIGGPSVKPYQPDGYYANLQFPDRPYKIDTGRKQYRRGLYVHWQRTFLHPMLANFDAPSREECLCNRTVANTPQQALTLLNDPTFTEAARVLADQLVSDKVLSSDAAKLESLYRRALARTPKAVELESLMKLLNAQRKYCEANNADAEKLLKVGLSPVTKASKPEVAAWTQVCRVVLNLHETITRY